MYTIVDVETTGGKFNEEGITEIAIYKFDGHEIVDQFSSLINPEKEIQPFVIKLTGITNKMLVKAPKFYQVAKRIIEITKDTILVAHNASFDYRMLRVEFDRLGYEFAIQTLCTVELAQQLMPEQPSHSLGKLTKALGIAIPNRHRAGGDALATVKLFQMLLEKDVDKTITRKLLKTMQPHKLQSNFKNLLDGLPTATGVYYFNDSEQKTIFIGKSRNIKKAATQHFLKESKKAQRLQVKVSSISFDKTGSELIAIIKEYLGLKTQQPSFNKRRRNHLFSHGLYLKTNNDGYKTLKIEYVSNGDDYITSFNSFQSGINFLEKLAQLNELNHQLLDLEKDNGTVIDSSNLMHHNTRLLTAIAPYSFIRKNLIIIDRGRTASERSAVLIENGNVSGYAYTDLKIQITDAAMLRSIMVPLESDKNNRHIVQSYLRHKKVVKIIDLDENDG